MSLKAGVAHIEGEIGLVTKNYPCEWTFGKIKFHVKCVSDSQKDNETD